jgi:hypothetical protein
MYNFSEDWMERKALNDTSIAQATLQFASLSDYVARVVVEYRQQTFLDALASLGGLLAVFQGVHLLCFGRPLFWGLFGLYKWSLQ